MWEQLFVQRGSDKTDCEEDEVSVQWSVEESGELLQIPVLTRAGVVRSCDQMIMHFIFIKLISDNHQTIIYIKFSGPVVY